VAVTVLSGLRALDSIEINKTTTKYLNITQKCVRGSFGRLVDVRVCVTKSFLVYGLLQDLYKNQKISSKL